VVCVDRFELIRDEAVSEIVEGARGMFSMFDVF